MTYWRKRRATELSDDPDIVRNNRQGYLFLGCCFIALAVTTYFGLR